MPARVTFYDFPQMLHHHWNALVSGVVQSEFIINYQLIGELTNTIGMHGLQLLCIVIIAS